MDVEHNVPSWYEVPVESMKSAIRFYYTVFEYIMSRNQAGSLEMGWFPWVENAGGRIIRGKTLIAEDHGYMAIFIVTEGNRVALHSRQ